MIQQGQLLAAKEGMGGKGGEGREDFVPTIEEGGSVMEPFGGRMSLGLDGHPSHCRAVVRNPQCL